MAWGASRLSNWEKRAGVDRDAGLGRIGLVDEAEVTMNFCSEGLACAIWWSGAIRRRLRARCFSDWSVIWTG